MNSLESLEAAKRGPFRFRHHGETYTVASPTGMHFQEILGVLNQEHIPGIPAMPFWQSSLLFRRWAAHFDLPSFRHAQRLCYLVDRYRDALEVDLRAAGVDLRALWQDRDWRSLLNAIDHLPQNCWYSEQVSNDPEHAAMLIEAMEAQKSDDSAPKGPPLRVWDQQTELFAKILDAVRQIPNAVMVSQGGKAVEIKPEPRPTSALETARRAATYNRRQAKHEALAARLLPHKAAKKADTQA